MEDNLDKRYQTLFILWFALLVSIAMYFLVTLFAAPATGTGPSGSTRSFLIFAVTALGTFLVIVSFAVKQKLLQRSVEKQDVNLVQKGLLLSCAMCEVSALLGLLEHFLIGNREYYLLFLLAAAGIIIHFPRRSQLEAASYTKPGQVT
jgi:NADH:ubiquinone oxidoreductase subunit 2 (subunit N)